MNVAAGLLLALATSSIAVPSLDGASLAHRVAENYTAQVRGAATFVVQTRTTVRSGPFTHTEFSETAYVEVDGLVAGKVVLRSLVNGSSANAGQLAKLSAEPDGPLSRFGLRLPVFEAAAGDYQYGDPLEPGERTSVAFGTTVKDEAHGDGTLNVDINQKRVVQVVIRPAVLPAHATRMNITIDFGRVYEGRWDIVKITRTFAGRQGLMSGTGTSASVYERYQSYASSAEAFKALAAIAPAAS